MKAKKAKATKGARDVEARHHTEAQIAAKKAKAAKGARDVEVESREPHHTEAQIAVSFPRPHVTIITPDIQQA